MVLRLELVLVIIINIGDKITKGSNGSSELLSVADAEAVENYIKEVQKYIVFKGLKFLIKHIEIHRKQMLRKMKVVEGGDTGCSPGTNVNVNAFTELNRSIKRR